MESRAKFLGHAIHQQLVPFPLGLLASAVIADTIAALGDYSNLARTAHHMVAFGLVFGVLAALFGVIDYQGIPGETRARRIGQYHGLGNAVVLVLFAAAWLIRRDEPTVVGTSDYILELLGGGLALVTGWLGGELVDRLGVGIDRNANLNAPANLETGIDLSGTGQRG